MLICKKEKKRKKRILTFKNMNGFSVGLPRFQKYFLVKLTYQFLILQLFNNNNIQKMVCFKTFHLHSNHEYRQPTFTMTSLKTEK